MKPRRHWTDPIADPECPAGWTTGPPDFVGVGAQRAGTTWWYRGAIRPHPGFVREAKPRKEVHFFDRFWASEPPPDIADRYARLFPRPPGAITGEWTPRYMHDYWTPALLARAAPEARILVMLRDPIERYRSGVTRERRIADEHDVRADIALVGDQLCRSLYADQLERLFELYPRERVLVLQYERCLADPLGEMRRTHEFLGLDPLADAPRMLLRDPPPGERPRVRDDLRAELVRRLTPDIERVAVLCPEIDVSLWSWASPGRAL